MANSVVLHDDYEFFAKRYLGVEYEDYVNLELGLPDEDVELEEIEYEIPQYA